MPRFHHAVLVAAALLPLTTVWSAVPAAANDVTGQAKALMADANSFWSQEIASLGGQYQPAALTGFTGQISGGACGAQGAFSGPFYCPANERVYLDQAFVRQVMQQAPGAEGDLALAYLIGHELGHHIQDLIGTTTAVEQARERSTPQVSRRTWMTAELQTDCYAGLSVRSALMHGQIKPGANVAATLDAVAAVSHERDTHLAGGQQMPDPVLDYGTAAQRLKWFQRGLNSGRFNDCDTFGAQAAGTL